MARSLVEAKAEFDAFARVDPRLEDLWELCESAAPPVRELDDADDDDDEQLDPYEGWCAEDFFLHHVKSRLMLLVGAYRPGPPHELHSTSAYDTVYDLLIHWALPRPCACCAEAPADAPELASW